MKSAVRPVLSIPARLHLYDAVAPDGLMTPALEGEQIARELEDAATVVVLRFGLFYGGVGNDSCHRRDQGWGW